MEINLLVVVLKRELHKPFIKKFKKSKIESTFIDNISVVDLADMQLISKFDKGIRFLLCVTGKKVLQLLMLFKNLR